jgi:hypothetical protein
VGRKSTNHDYTTEHHGIERRVDLPDRLPFPNGQTLGVPRHSYSNASQPKDAAMTSLIEWFIPALIGIQFTLLGSLKLYGLCRGVVGGADKPFVTRLCGT